MTLDQGSLYKNKLWFQKFGIFSAIIFSKLVEFAVRKSKFSLKFVTMWQKFATKKNNSYDLCSAFLPTIKTLLHMSPYILPKTILQT